MTNDQIKVLVKGAAKRPELIQNHIENGVLQRIEKEIKGAKDALTAISLVVHEKAFILTAEEMAFLSACVGVVEIELKEWEGMRTVYEK